MKENQETKFMGRASAKGASALAEVLSLPDNEKEWFLHSLFSGLSSDLWEKVKAQLDGGVSAVPDPTDQARALLLDNPNLSAPTKVLLAAFYLKGVYELESFTSRQITEFLKDSGNQIPNITSTIKGLTHKSQVEVIDTIGATEQAHKRFELTPAGEKAVLDAIAAHEQEQELVAAKATG